MSDLEPGRVIGGGRFRLERLLGEGGMGVVWLAAETGTGKHVALKFLTASGALRKDFRERLRREARATAAVNHPNVVQILEVIEDASIPVIVMEYLVGETLADRLERDKPLSLEVTASILVPVVSAVGTAHAAGIVHRDLKPENIFLERASDGTMVPHVLDFGLAKIVKPEVDPTHPPTSSGDTQTGAILGTPFYMSPEQASGERGIDQRADIWSLGIILYECLSGRVPFSGENFGQFFKRLIAGNAEPLTKHCPKLPPDVASIVMRALDVDRTTRLADLRELAEVLRPLTTVDAMPFSTPGKSRDMWSDPELPTFKTIVDGDEIPFEPTEPARPAAKSPMAASAIATIIHAPAAEASRPKTDVTPPPIAPSLVQASAPVPEAAPPRYTALYAIFGSMALIGLFAILGVMRPWKSTGLDTTPKPPATAMPSATPSASVDAPLPPMTASASSSAEPLSSAPTTPSASASVAHTKPPASTGRIVSAPSASAAASASSGAKLQGGVAGQVPF